MLGEETLLGAHTRALVKSSVSSPCRLHPSDRTPRDHFAEGRCTR